MADIEFHYFAIHTDTHTELGLREINKEDDADDEDEDDDDITQRHQAAAFSFIG